MYLMKFIVFLIANLENKSIPRLNIIFVQYYVYGDNIIYFIVTT